MQLLKEMSENQAARVAAVRGVMLAKSEAKRVTSDKVAAEKKSVSVKKKKCVVRSSNKE